MHSYSVDGTHIGCEPPVTVKEDYINRHHYCSLNVQIVGGKSYRIYSVISSHPGSNNDMKVCDYNYGVY